MITLNSSQIATQSSDVSINKNLSGTGTKSTHPDISSQTSIYDIYGIEEGFSHKLSNADKVTLSPIGKMLSEAQSLAESQRETWGDPSKIFESEVEFNAVFKEVQSEDGGLVFRKFNSAYLDQIQSAPDALLLYEQINKADKNGVVVTSNNDVDGIVFKLRKIAAEDRFNSLVNLANKSAELVEAKKGFDSALAEKNPNLKGVELEFSLQDDEVVITGGKLNGFAISDKDIRDIQQLANGSSGKELRDVMLSIRDDSIQHYNRYTEAGRKDPLTAKDFEQRFGDFNSYPTSFTGSGNSNAKDKTSFYASAADVISSRLAS